MRSLPLVAGLLPFALAPLTAQSTLLVGPGGLPQIGDALAVATAGDTILVQPGTYAQFRCTIPVTIRAAVAGTVTVALDPSVAPPGCVFDPICAGQLLTSFALTAGQTAHVVDITFAPTVEFTVSHRVLVTGGRVTFDGCHVAADAVMALRVGDAAVHLQDCVIENVHGFQPAFAGYAADVTATRCQFLGGDSALTNPNHAVQLQDSRFVGSHLTLIGGDSNFAAFGTGGHALFATGSEVWIADSALSSQDNACPVMVTATSGRIGRTTLAPTVTSTGTVCTSGPVLPTGPVVGVERLQPPTNGASFGIQVHTEPNTLVAIHASGGLGTVAVPGLFEQPVSLGLADFWLASVTISDPSGLAGAAWNLPAGSFQGTPLWLEAIAFVPSLPIQVGPIVGGIVR